MTNRRKFLERMVAAPFIGAFPYKGRADTRVDYAYVGRLSRNGDSIEVFRVDGHRWTPVQRVASRTPTGLAVHPTRSVLYAANAVTVDAGLPRGTVEVFAMDRKTGSLSLLQRRALSLSGTEPRSLAVSPDGRYLAVAIYGGGAYNVFAIAEDGTLGPLTHIFKEIGCGAHPEHQASAHPHTLIFDSRGRFLLASDAGCDQLSAFVINANGELERTSKILVRSGAGPSAITLDPSESVLYVRNGFEPTISCHCYRAADGTIEAAFRSIEAPVAQAVIPLRSNWVFVPAA